MAVSALSLGGVNYSPGQGSRRARIPTCSSQNGESARAFEQGPQPTTSKGEVQPIIDRRNRRSKHSPGEAMEKCWSSWKHRRADPADAHATAAGKIRWMKKDARDMRKALRGCTKPRKLTGSSLGGNAAAIERSPPVLLFALIVEALAAASGSTFRHAVSPRSDTPMPRVRE